MPVTIAVDDADERLVSLLRKSCPRTQVECLDGRPWAIVARRRAREDGGWDLELRLPADGSSPSLVSVPGELIEDQLSRVGGLVEALAEEVGRRQESMITSWIERLACERTPDAMFSQFVAATREASRAERVSLLFPDPSGERFLVIAGDDESGTTGEVAGGQSATVESLGGEMLPLQWGDDVFGFVRIEWTATDTEGKSRVSRFIERATPILHASRELSRERELALRDDLTRAYNRRYFDAALEEEIERSRRFSMALSLIFLDLDELKSVNSRWGHLTGSRVLQEVARRILGAVRTIDRVVRFGGDEFCIVLPKTDADQASVVASRVRDAISEIPIRFADTDEIHITASFGIASYPLHAGSRDELIHAADEAMYKVKSGSKNSISVAVTPTPH